MTTERQAMIIVPHTRMSYEGKKNHNQIQHKNEHLQGLSSVFWHAKDFTTTYEVAARARETQPVVLQWLKSALINGLMFLRCHHIRILTFSSSGFHVESNRDSVTQSYVVSRLHRTESAFKGIEKKITKKITKNQLLYKAPQ